MINLKTEKMLRSGWTG